MPTYDYICGDCDNEIEVFQRMSEDPLKECPACEKPALRRKIGLGAGIIFKGSGFYETDFKDRKGSKTDKSESSSSEASPSKSESAKPEKSAETKPAPAAATSAA